MEELYNISLVCEHLCAAFSWLLIDVGGPVHRG